MKIIDRVSQTTVVPAAPGRRAGHFEINAGLVRRATASLCIHNLHIQKRHGRAIRLQTARPGIAARSPWIWLRACPRSRVGPFRLCLAPCLQLMSSRRWLMCANAQLPPGGEITQSSCYSPGSACAGEKFASSFWRTSVGRTAASLSVARGIEWHTCPCLLMWERSSPPNLQHGRSRVSGDRRLFLRVRAPLSLDAVERCRAGNRGLLLQLYGGPLGVRNPQRAFGLRLPADRQVEDYRCVESVVVRRIRSEQGFRPIPRCAERTPGG